MKDSIEIGCPIRQHAWANFALKIALLFLAAFSFGVQIPAQCHTTNRDIHAFTLLSDCFLGDAEEKSQFIDLKIAGTTNANEMVLVMQSDADLLAIDSIQIEYIIPEAHLMPSPQFSWLQDDDRKRLTIAMQWDPCNPVYQSLFHFRLKAFCATQPITAWRFIQIDGGIVQVDVIQAKTSGMETQRILSIHGTLLREVERPVQSPPATEGLDPGIYLLQRIVEGKLISTGKILVI